MKKSLVLVLIIAIAIAIGVALRPQERVDSSRLKIATTIFPLYDIAQNIVGDKAEVVQILPSGASEHNFSPTIQTQTLLANSDAVFYIGHELDEWVLDVVENTSPNAQKIVVDKNINLLAGEDEGKKDLHYWLSVTNVIEIANTVKNTVVSLDQVNQTTYEANYAKYLNELTQLKVASQAKINTLENKTLITFHEAFAYFAQDFGLEIPITIEEFPGDEPSPAYLTEVGEIIREHNIKVLFKEPQLSDSIVQSLAKDYNVEVKTLDPVGGIEGRDSIIKLIEYNVNTIVEALDE